MAFTQGNKHATGGRRKGSGRKPLPTRELCQKAFHERIPLLAKMADNEALEPRDRINAIKLLGSVGIPQQHEVAVMPGSVAFTMPEMPKG